MSVRGEFVRLVGEAAQRLRGGSDGAETLADALQRARETAAHDLEAAAENVLALWGDGSTEALELSDDARTQLEASAERMLAVSRIILGR